MYYIYPSNKKKDLSFDINVSFLIDRVAFSPKEKGETAGISRYVVDVVNPV